MLDKTSEEYKKVTKLYKQGKISETDLNRLLSALENYEQTEEETATADETSAERTVGQLIKDLGIKISASLKTGWDTLNDVTEKAADSLRTTIRSAARKIADGIDGENESDPCRSPEEYSVPYEKLYIRLNYVGKKTVEITAKVKKQKSLSEKCKKIMSAEMHEKLDSLLAEPFVGKYEISKGDEYMRLLVRPKKQL